MTGHVRRRGERSFELKFDVGADPLTGKRRVRYHSFKGTRREAEIELAKMVAAVAKEEYVDPSRLTVSQFFDRWERDWATHNLTPKTLERYRELLRKHVRPHVGDQRLQKLRPLALNTLYAKLLREGQGDKGGLAARTVGHVHRVLHRALGHALQWGLVQHNVAAIVQPPRVPETEVEILSPDQVRIVLDKMADRSIYPIIQLALATGMRRGELCALRWGDVNLDAARLRVERSLEQTKEGLRFKAPKTAHGRRSIALPLSAVAMLRAHWKSQQELRLRLGLGKAQPGDLVFGRWDGSPRHPDALTNLWTVAIKAVAALPRVTFHSLRHTHASQLFAAGVDIVTVSRRLGHASPTVTLRVYAHLVPNTDDRAASAIEAAIATGRET